MRGVRSTAVVAVGLIGLAGCSGGVPQSDPDDPDQVEIVTWVTSGRDRDGLAALRDAFGRSDPGITVIDGSVAGGADTALAAVRTRFDSDNPPDVFQVRGGEELADFVFAGRVSDLGDVFDSSGMATAIPAQLLEQIRVAGNLYAVPVAIERANLAWANTAVLTDAGLDPRRPADDLDAWLVQLEELRRSGVEYPLVVGRNPTALFENVLLARLGADRYVGLWNGQTRWDGAALPEAIETFGRLLEYTDPGLRGADEDRVAGQLVDGLAAFAVLPDDAAERFDAAGLRFGVDVTGNPVPGTAGVFGFAATAFAMPVDPSHPASATRWLELVASADGQLQLALAAGSIPARIDVQTSDLSPVQQIGVNALASNRIVPSLTLGAAASATWTAAVINAVRQYTVDGRPAALRNALVTAASDSGT